MAAARSNVFTLLMDDAEDATENSVDREALDKIVKKKNVGKGDADTAGKGNKGSGDKGRKGIVDEWGGGGGGGGGGGDWGVDSSKKRSSPGMLVDWVLSLGAESSSCTHRSCNLYCFSSFIVCRRIVSEGWTWWTWWTRRTWWSWRTRRQR